MSKQGDGGPAFPMDHEYAGQHPGMTLRDYFAAKALQGIVFYQAARLREDPSRPDPDLITAMSAKEAYALADAMLTERAK